MTHQYTFYPAFTMVGQFEVALKNGNLRSGTPQSYLTMKRWTRHILNVQLLAPAPMCSDEVMHDERVSDFVRDHWRDLIVPHPTHATYEPQEFDQIDTEFDGSYGMSRNVLLRSGDIEARVASGSLVRQIEDLGYDASKHLLVLPLRSVVVEATAPTAPPTAESSKKRKTTAAEREEQEETVQSDND